MKKFISLVALVAALSPLSAFAASHAEPYVSPLMPIEMSTEHLTTVSGHAITDHICVGKRYDSELWQDFAKRVALGDSDAAKADYAALWISRLHTTQLMTPQCAGVTSL